MRSIKHRFHHGKKTESAGTAIVVTVPAEQGAKAVLTRLKYTPGATSHAANVLRAQGSTTTTAAASAGGSTLVVASNAPATDVNNTNLGETLAANDYIVVKHSNGHQVAYTISSIDTATNTITINGTLSYNVDSGATVWVMHELARTLGKPAIVYDLPTGSTTDLTGGGNDAETGIATSENVNEPLVVSINNATNAGTLVAVGAVYHRF